MLDKPRLAQAYRSADVLVFPSLTDTFGLVMIEAMACGTPVAAYPVDGPLEVFHNTGNGQPLGGVMHADLMASIQAAQAIPRPWARAHALRFSWEEAGRQFLSNLVPTHTRL
jgi:glycosyltransferase involved in cell wall biosynthesis